MSAGRRKGQKVGPFADRQKERCSGSWLYAERMARGLTIDAAAALLAVSRRTIIRIERGQGGHGRYQRTRAAMEQRIRHALGLLPLLGVTFGDRKK